MSIKVDVSAIILAKCPKKLFPKHNEVVFLLIIDHDFLNISQNRKRLFNKEDHLLTWTEHMVIKL